MYASFGDYLFLLLLYIFFTTLLSVRIWSIFPFYSQPTGLLDVRTNNYIITSHFLTRFFPPQLPTFLYSLIYNVSHSLFLPPLTLCYLLPSRCRSTFVSVSLSLDPLLPSPDPHKSVEISYDPRFITRPPSYNILYPSFFSFCHSTPFVPSYPSP